MTIILLSTRLLLVQLVQSLLELVPLERTPTQLPLLYSWTRKSRWGCRRDQTSSRNRSRYTNRSRRSRQHRSQQAYRTNRGSARTRNSRIHSPGRGR